MKKLMAVLMMTSVSLALHAQNIPLDFGVASEVVRTMMSAQTGQSILSSTNLMANYRNFALEQEMAREAARRGITERIDVLRTIEDMRREVLIRALRSEVIAAAKTPSEEEIAREYKKLSDRLVLPKSLRLDVYSISAAETQLFERATAMLSSQEDAAGPLTKRGFVHVTGQADASWFTANQVTEAIWNELLTMPAGEARIFPDGSNVLLIKKLEERESRPMTLDESRELISNLLMRDAQNQLWNDFVTEKAKSLGL